MHRNSKQFSFYRNRLHLPWVKLGQQENGSMFYLQEHNLLKCASFASHLNASGVPLPPMAAAAAYKQVAGLCALGAVPSTYPGIAPALVPTSQPASQGLSSRRRSQLLRSGRCFALQVFLTLLQTVSHDSWAPPRSISTPARAPAGSGRASCKHVQVHGVSIGQTGNGADGVRWKVASACIKACLDCRRMRDPSH